MPARTASLARQGREVVEQYYRLRCQHSDRYLCVSEEGDLALCADKNRADQFQTG